MSTHLAWGPIVVLLVAACSGPAQACSDLQVRSLLQRAEEARSWSEFWEDLDPNEARVEMLRTRWYLSRAELLVLRDRCLDTASGAGFGGRIADGQRWVRRAAAQRARVAASAVAAVSP